MSARMHNPVQDQPATVPRAWLTPEVLPYRACDLCDHVQGTGPQRVCTAPPLVWAGRAIPITQARQPHGGCGPDALHMSAPWLKA